MSKLDIIRAWKDEEYREGLSAAERSRLPQNPAGLIELTEPDLAEVAGGTISYPGGCDSYITICTHINYCLFTITIGLEADQLQ